LALYLSSIREEKALRMSQDTSKESDRAKAFWHTELQGEALVLALLVLLATFGSCKNNPVGPTPEVDSLFVIEKDHLFGGFGGVDNYHETIVINKLPGTIDFSVESPFPDTLKHASLRSPSFGRSAMISTPFEDFFDLPSVHNTLLTGNPSLSFADAYVWLNLNIGPADMEQVPYSNYYADDGRAFVLGLGKFRFLCLDMILQYSIEFDPVDSTEIDIEITEKMQNTSGDTLFRVGASHFVPRETHVGSSYTQLYNLISDTVISPSDNPCYLFNAYYTSDGFGSNTSGQEMDTGWFTLLPFQAYEFDFKMIIKPLLSKFEIYPSFATTFIALGGGRIWPSSKICVHGDTFNGQVHYLKECGLVMPTYVLLSIDNGTLKVASPDEIMANVKLSRGNPYHVRGFKLMTNGEATRK